VQGSVLGPILFNIYTSQLPQILGHEAFTVSYADDTYVCISCHPSQLSVSVKTLEAIAATHVEWLKELGMIINPGKTDFIIFGYNGPTVNFDMLGAKVQNSNTLKILGVIFESNMKWSRQANQVIKSINYFNYSLRILRMRLTQKQHKQIIHSFVISRIAYSISLWGANLNSRDKRRLASLLFKIIRLHCRDFNNIHSNRELCEINKFRSLNSIRIMADAIMLHRIVTLNSCTSLTIRLIQQTTYSGRFPNSLIFFDCSNKWIGRHSFINRAKQISEVIRFPWIDLTPEQFKLKLRQQIPYYISS